VAAWTVVGGRMVRTAGRRGLVVRSMVVVEYKEIGEK